MNLSDWNNLFMNAVVEYSNYVLNMKILLIPIKHLQNGHQFLIMICI